ncbi:hypothetical protein SAMN05421835_106168 [Amycolatopsis sacchari]|uniref:Uncharacterized protein n=1 Tax=Amycolatopsis sacchari TaxID=115433 RepID=A0A1I3S9J6_9PSEU|nr:hypothetical protein SAMN05421835_106168 [Amycolatopsis sacchari]
MSPLGAAALGYADVRFDGLHYASDRRGSTTVIAEVAPGRGRPDGETLDAAAGIAVLLPNPSYSAFASSWASTSAKVKVPVGWSPSPRRYRRLTATRMPSATTSRKAGSDIRARSPGLLR